MNNFVMFSEAISAQQKKNNLSYEVKLQYVRDRIINFNRKEGEGIFFFIFKKKKSFDNVH